MMYAFQKGYCRQQFLEVSDLEKDPKLLCLVYNENTLKVLISLYPIRPGNMALLLNSVTCICFDQKLQV